MNKKILAFALVLVSAAFYLGCTVDGVAVTPKYCYMKIGNDPRCVDIDNTLTEDLCSVYNGVVINDCNNPPQLKYCYIQLTSGVICQVINDKLTVAQCSETINGEVIDDCNNPPAAAPTQYCLIGSTCQILDSVLCAFSNGVTVSSCTSSGN